MCCGDLILLVLFCKHIGEMVRDKGREPLAYQVLAVIGWIGGEILGIAVGIVVVGLLSDWNDDATATGAGVGCLLGLVCGVGPVYLLASSVSRDPNYRAPPQPLGTSPYGPPPGAASNPYGSPPPQHLFVNPPPQPASAPPPVPQSPFATGTVTAPNSTPPAIPHFLPSSAFSPAAAAPQRVQFYCPSGHLLEESSAAAGQQRRCPHCGGVATVPTG